MRTIVTRATLDDLHDLAPLFDNYRQFYGQPGDLNLAREFLSERLERQQSVIFLARDGVGKATGFAQLYPMFSSTLAQSAFVLNDLFVSPDARRSGVGAALLCEAANYGRESGAAWLKLATALDNFRAQSLYEAQGWKRDEIFCTYILSLKK